MPWTWRIRRTLRKNRASRRTTSHGLRLRTQFLAASRGELPRRRYEVDTVVVLLGQLAGWWEADEERCQSHEALHTGVLRVSGDVGRALSPLERTVSRALGNYRTPLDGDTMRSLTTCVKQGLRADALSDVMAELGWGGRVPTLIGRSVNGAAAASPRALEILEAVAAHYSLVAEGDERIAIAVGESMKAARDDTRDDTWVKRVGPNGILDELVECVRILASDEAANTAVTTV